MAPDGVRQLEGIVSVGQGMLDCRHSQLDILPRAGHEVDLEALPVALLARLSLEVDRVLADPRTANSDFQEGRLAGLDLIEA